MYANEKLYNKHLVCESARLYHVSFHTCEEGSAPRVGIT